MHRLFVALRPPRALRALLLDAMGGVPGARWQSDDQLHLTLRFVGEVDRHRAQDIAAALGTIHQRAFAIALDGVGQFDRRGQIDAVWAGVTPHAPLIALHNKVDRALVRIGLPPEGRAYLPHITLARLARGSPGPGCFAATHAGLVSPPVEIGEFCLYESALGTQGASYAIVARYPLA